MPQSHDRAAAPDDLDAADWQVSTFSGSSGSCVAVARLDEGTIAVRNSNAPSDGVVFFTRSEIDAFLRGARAGEFDHFAE